MGDDSKPMDNLKTMNRKVNKIKSGAYKVTDCKGTFIIRNNGGVWTAYDCSDIYETTDENNWGVCFKTKKALLNYASKF